MSYFSEVKELPPDPIFGLKALFLTDENPDKINLTVGVCTEPDGKAPHVWESVKLAEKYLLEHETTKDYLPLDGDKAFNELTARLVLGDDLFNRVQNRTIVAQTPGGTGALRIGFDLLQRNITNKVAISDPTWANHVGILDFIKIDHVKYPYYDRKRQVVDFKRCKEFLSTLEPKTAVLLQAGAHNPTGIGFSNEEWEELSELFFAKKLIPFFDSAYQGLSDDLDTDAHAIRMFIENGHECLIATSYAKNFSIYSERIGAVMVVVSEEAQKAAVLSQVKGVVRATYSNPPRHGAAVVAYVLGNPECRAVWEKELKQTRERINGARAKLAATLRERSNSDRFDYFSRAKGFFSLFDFTKEEVERLRKEEGIYLTGSGRINIIGVIPDRLDYVVDGILRVVS